jgi:hypothetical protein
MKEAIDKGTEFVDEFLVPISEIKDEPIYDVNCSKGHKTQCLLMNEKFEVLFDLGFNGFIDGYYREAVLSFASALERFHEFLIRVILHDDVNSRIFDDAWKIVRNQSERQLGAFVFLYLLKIKECPPMLNEQDVAFRNGVIHKGYIPTSDETIEFGENVRSVVNIALKNMKRIYGDNLIRILEAPFKELEKRYGIKYGCTITPILDCRSGASFAEDDVRNKPMREIIPTALSRREPQRIRMFKTKTELDAAKSQL